MILIACRQSATLTLASADRRSEVVMSIPTDIANSRITLAFAFLLLIQSGCTNSAKQGSLDFEIYALKGNSERELLAKGAVKCDGNNVKSIERSTLGTRWWQNYVPLWQDWIVGASIYREKDLNGFGLWIHNKDGGFSWNWFTRESRQIYRKLKGDGHVEAKFVPNKDYEELVAVEFLDDIALTGNFGWFPFGDTHHVIIKKGSVLRLAR
jgi:hypothetical protein